MFTRRFDVRFEIICVSFDARFAGRGKGGGIGVTAERFVDELVFLRRLTIVARTLSGDGLNRPCAENQSSDEEEFQI